jgi:hypothetical protein
MHLGYFNFFQGKQVSHGESVVLAYTKNQIVMADAVSQDIEI